MRRYWRSGDSTSKRVLDVLEFLALSRISPRVRVRDSVSIVYRIAPGGYSWIWPSFLSETVEDYSTVSCSSRVFDYIRFNVKTQGNEKPRKT